MWFVTDGADRGPRPAAAGLDRAARQPRQQHSGGDRNLAGGRGDARLCRRALAGGSTAEGQRRGGAALGRIGRAEIFAEMAERRVGRRQEARRHPAGSRSRGRQSFSGRGRDRYQCRRCAGGHADAGDFAFGASAFRSARRSCSRRCRTPGSNSAASGTMAAALPRSAACGWSAPPASARRSRSRPGSATVEGIFDTIDETGCLIVRTADGRRVPVAAGEVYFGSVASVGAA